MESLLWRNATGLTLLHVISKISKETCSFLCGGDLLKRQPVMFSTGPEDPVGRNSSLARVPGITELLLGNGFIFQTQHHRTHFPSHSGREAELCCTEYCGRSPYPGLTIVLPFPKAQRCLHIPFPSRFFLVRWSLSQALVALGAGRLARSRVLISRSASSP